jgi:hypothetical protein
MRFSMYVPSIPVTAVQWDNLQVFASLLVLYPVFRETDVPPAIFPQVSLICRG